MRRFPGRNKRRAVMSRICREKLRALVPSRDGSKTDAARAHNVAGNVVLNDRLGSPGADTGNQIGEADQSWAARTGQRGATVADLSSRQWRMGLRIRKITGRANRVNAGDKTIVTAHSCESRKAAFCASPATGASDERLGTEVRR